MNRIFAYILLFTCIGSGSYSQKADLNSAGPLHRAQQALTDILVHDIFSPPVASRIYAYSNIAAYEVFSNTIGGSPSLHRAYKKFPDLSFIKSNKKISPSLASVYAFLVTAKNYIFSEKRLEDSIQLILQYYKKNIPDAQVYKNSLLAGKQIADSIISWSSKDGYRRTRSLRRYTYKKEAGKWIPTPPAYMAAVEPYWGQMRPMIMDSASQFKPSAPPPYMADTSGIFYRQVMEVYSTGRSLSKEQRDIALFWDCNPFFVNTSGHLVFATKKLSPGGHWISIAAIACRKTGKDIAETAKVYMLTSLALYDGFISCWDEKFRSNFIRPETVINSMVDENWRPLLQTPPFPEYTSGHSVISTSAAFVLSSLFGEEFGYIDSTETSYGLPTRDFTSFNQAANEAAISRLYGGIHFREAIVNGQEQGRRIGGLIVQQLQEIIDSSRK